jgi:hypothetical protein
MKLTAEYKEFMTHLLTAASSLFFGGRDPEAMGMKVSTSVNIEGTGLDGQQHLDTETGLCYVQISETASFMGDQVPLLTKFAIAHELGHLCAAEIGGQIGTATVNLGSQKHEVAADLIGTCLLLKLKYTPIMITSVLGEQTGGFVMDEEAHGTHPSRKARVGFMVALFTKLRSQGKGEVEAIRLVLEGMG